MTPEQKGLLLKDLCARLPYGIKILVNDKVEMVQGVNVLDNVIEYDSCLSSEVEEVKPYLFPLSSMTAEQKKEFRKLIPQDSDGAKWLPATFWLIENMFDIFDLIPKNLALDATDKNIY